MSTLTIGLHDARHRLAELAELAHYRGQFAILSRRGRKLAAIVPLTFLESLTQHSDHAGHVPTPVANKQS